MTGGRRPGRTDHDDPGRDDRGVSEFAGVAILIGITMLVTASVGLFVLVGVTADGPGPNANFSFRYISESSVLIVTHDRGDNFTASNLSVRGQGADVRWYEVAGTDPNATVAPGASVQLSEQNAYGREVTSGANISIVHAPPAGNETLLDRWKGTV
jgi:FlaG/FlaF family flagellin (archaellin)